MPAHPVEQPRRRLVSAKLTEEENRLLHRACRRLGISRTEAVYRGIRRLIERQRQVEALQPLT